MLPGLRHGQKIPPSLGRISRAISMAISIKTIENPSSCNALGDFFQRCARPGFLPRSLYPRRVIEGKVPPMDEVLEEWFIREILSHEAALTRYIARAWPNAADVPDLRQEIYVRVLETAEKARPAAPKYFLFTVARNLIIDRARRKRIVPIDLLQDCDSLNVLVDEVSPERRAGSFQQLVSLVGAFERLPQRCREVLWMKKIQDLSQKEIAGRLGLKEGTIEAHLVRGMRLLTKHFHEGAELDPGVAKRAGRSTEELQHGD